MGWEVSIKGFIGMKPVAWARPRFNNGRGFELLKVKNAKAHFQWLARKEMGLPELSDSPLKVELDFHYIKAPKPKRHLKEFPAKRPDIDNLVKFVLDAGNDYLWKDDDQIVDITAVKNYGEIEGIFLTLSTWSSL